jgi:hypothetical protein
MLPSPPSSCAGWWFAQLWRRVLSERPERIGSWRLTFERAGDVRLVPVTGTGSVTDVVYGHYPLEGEPGDGIDGPLMVARYWPGEDGMLHTLRLTWHMGEVAVYPATWARTRGEFPESSSPDQVPWPHSLPIVAMGRDGQLLDQAMVEVAGTRLQWRPPVGGPRLPDTDLPCSLVMGDERQAAELILAGLPLPWKIDLDREAWPIWRRLDAGAMLSALGGPRATCPLHGVSCSWPLRGRSRG